MAKFVKLILKILLYPLVDVIYFLSVFIPKQKMKWLFGSWFGQRYADNSRYLFEYVLKEHPEVRAIWITHNRQVLQQLRREGKPCLFYLSPRGIFHTLTARVVVMSTDKSDINTHLLGPGHFKVQLWHGIGYKKILYDDRITANLHKPLTRLKHFLFPFLKPKFDMVIATSRETRRQFCGAFRLPPEKVPITGYPRNDIFFQQNGKRQREDQRKTILYAPTHRKEGEGMHIRQVLPSEEFLQRLDEKMEAWGARFLFRLHFYDEPYLPPLEGYRHIEKAAKMDAQELLLHTDVLITDYSSIYFDFLLLDRPIIFTPFDLEDYLSHDREFHYPYEQVTPGPRARNWDEALQYIEEALKSPEKYREERQRILDIFHEYRDGQSSQRVFQEILRRIS